MELRTKAKFRLDQSKNGGVALPRSVRMKLAKSRDDRGWDQAELARRLGIGVIHMGKLERGLATAKWDMLRLWAKMLGFEVVVGLTDAA
jgi:ribosome-binding protein aMBF1 (putative translation factor)